MTLIRLIAIVAANAAQAVAAVPAVRAFVTAGTAVAIPTALALKAIFAGPTIDASCAIDERQQGLLGLLRASPKGNRRAIAVPINKLSGFRLVIVRRQFRGSGSA